MPESWAKKAETVGSGALINGQQASVRWHEPSTGATASAMLETEIIAKGMTNKRTTEYGIR